MIAERFEVWSDLVCKDGERLAVLTDVLSARDVVSVDGEGRTVTNVPRETSAWEHFQEQRILHFVEADGTYHERRIKRIRERQSDAGLLGEITAEPIRFDLLGDGLLERIEANGLAQLHFEIYGRPLTEHVDIILGAFAPFHSGAPAHFSKGTIEPDDDIDMVYHWDTPLSALQEAAKITESELHITRDGDDGYLVHFLFQINEDAAVPLFAISRNLIDVEHTTSSEQQGNRTYPQGASPEEGLDATIAENAFEVLALDGNEVQFVEDLVLEDGQLDGMGLYAELPDGTFTEVTDSEAPDLVTLASVAGLSAGSLVTFRRNSDGHELTYLEKPSSITVYGRIPKIVNRGDIPGVNNLVRNPFLSDWTAGLPDHWNVQGGATVEQETSELFRRFGSSSAHVTGVKGDGLFTSEISVNPTEIHPHFSAQIGLWVVSGAVRLELWDVTDINDPTRTMVWPPDVANKRGRTSVVGNWVDDLMIGPGENFFNLATTTMQMYVLIDSEEGEFYLDVGQVTRTAAGAPFFVGGRGANDLWIAGNDDLFLYAEPLSVWRTGVMDLNRLDPDRWPDEEIVVGGNVRVIVTDLDDLSLTTRAMRIDRNLLKETDVQVDVATELQLLTAELARTQRRRRSIRKDVPENTQKPPCPSWLEARRLGDLEVTWERVEAARYELRAPGEGETDAERWANGTRLTVTDTAFWVLKEGDRVNGLAPVDITEIMIETYNKWGVPGDCIELGIIDVVDEEHAIQCPNLMPLDAGDTFCTEGEPTGDVTIKEYDPIIMDEVGLLPGQGIAACAEGATTPAGEVGPNGHIRRTERGLIRHYDFFGFANQPLNDRPEWSAPDGWDIEGGVLVAKVPGVAQFLDMDDRLEMFVQCMTDRLFTTGVLMPAVLTRVIGSSQYYGVERWAHQTGSSFQQTIGNRDGIGTTGSIPNSLRGELRQHVLPDDPNSHDDIFQWFQGSQIAGTAATFHYGVPGKAGLETRPDIFTGGTGPIHFEDFVVCTNRLIRWDNEQSGYTLVIERDAGPDYGATSLTLSPSISMGPQHAPFQRAVLYEGPPSSNQVMDVFEPADGIWPGDRFEVDIEGGAEENDTGVRLRVEVQDDGGSLITSFTSAPVQTSGLSDFQRIVGPQGLLLPSTAHQIVVKGLREGDDPGDACIRRVQLNVGTSCCPFAEPGLADADPLTVTFYDVEADLCGDTGNLTHTIHYELPSFIEDPSDLRWSLGVEIWENGILRIDHTDEADRHPADTSPIVIVEAPGAFGHFKNANDAEQRSYVARVRLYSFTTALQSDTGNTSETWGEDCDGVPV